MSSRLNTFRVALGVESSMLAHDSFVQPALRKPMTNSRYRFIFALLCVLILLPFVAGHAQQPQSATTVPQILDVQGGKIRVLTIASGLFHPWSLAFSPDGRTILVTERNGR